MIINMDNFGFFDWSEGDSDAYAYSASEFSQFISAMMGNGVAYGWGNRFEETHTGLTVTLGSGLCCIDGRWGFSTDSKAITVAANDTTYIYCAVDTVDRVFTIETGSSVPTGAQALYKVVSDATSITSITDERSFAYTGGALDSARVIYKRTAPTAETGAIWLRPID